MFGSLGFGEIMMILIIGLIIFGPKKLPEIGRSLGKAIQEFRRASNDIVNTFSLDTADYTAPSRRSYSDYPYNSSTYSDTSTYLDQAVAQSDVPADDPNVAPSPEEPYEMTADESNAEDSAPAVRRRTGARRVLASARNTTAHRNTRRRV